MFLDDLIIISCLYVTSDTAYCVRVYDACEELCESHNVTDHRQATDDAVSAAVSQQTADEDVSERVDEQRPADDHTSALDSVDDHSASVDSVELSKEDL